MDMLTLAEDSQLDRDRLVRCYQENRRRSEQLFSLIDPRAYYGRPIPLRHPFVFYEGHLPAFSFLTLNEHALHEQPLDPRLEKLFERGIDPSSLTDAQRHTREDWPSRDEALAFGKACDERVIQAIGNAQLVDSNEPRLVRGQAVFTILEHEQMHHETLLYIIHQLDPSLKRSPITENDTARKRVTAARANTFIRINAGKATLGAEHDEIAFGWDNEFEKTVVDVPEFSIQRYPITNGDWLEFVEAGGSIPAFWHNENGTWYLRGVFESFPLPLAWPVYVTHEQAEAYARWKRMRLPTEAEYHRAAFSAPSGGERAFPWGNEMPEHQHGNFDFQRYDPEDVDAHPAGASAWGVENLIGNGWECTGTPFAPLPGFSAMASYPKYSTDFFDGKHYVMKGASPVTSKDLIRRSFRNWFYGDYPFMYAKFRCVVS